MLSQTPSTATAPPDPRPPGAPPPDLLAWAREFLPDHFTDEPADFHAELFRDLASDDRLLARVAPRGHAKSTCAALAYPLWCICEQQRRNIVIITHEASLATQFVRDIRHELETNERIRARYGDLCAPDPPPPAASAPRRPRRRASTAAAPPPPAPPASLPGDPAAAECSAAAACPAADAQCPTAAAPDCPAADAPAPSARAPVFPAASDTAAPPASSPPLKSARRPVRPAIAGPRPAHRRPVRPAEPAPVAAGAEPTPDPQLQLSGAPARRRKWSQSLLITTTGIALQAKSTGASFRGAKIGPHRPDLIICDDIEKDEHVATPEGRAKLENWLRRVVLPALTPHGKLAVLGSLIHHDSLLANLARPRRFPRWNYRIYRALEPDFAALNAPAPGGDISLLPGSAASPAEGAPPPSSATGGPCGLRALWPARWPVERLLLERERIGTRAFEQEYQANPIDDSVSAFRPEWLRRYDPADLAGRDLLHLLAVDPATGTAHGDYFALWAGAVDLDTGVIYTRELVLERIGIVEQVRRIRAAFRRWRPVRIGIEVNGYQAALRQILDDVGRRQHEYLPIAGLTVSANKRARIEGVIPFFENGSFRLPPDLDPEVELQFLQFPNSAHDDAPDVCALALELARSLLAIGRLECLHPPNSHPRRALW